MGLFVQKITLNLSGNDYVVERLDDIKLDKNKIDVYIAPGTRAIIGGVSYKGQETPYKLSRDLIGSKQTGASVYLYPDKSFDSISLTFFGGQHTVSVSSLPQAKAKFSIVGSATVEISDYKDLAEYFKRSLTRQDLVDEITKNFRPHLADEVGTAASKYITPSTTEVTLRAALDSVAKEVIQSRKTASLLMRMGLRLSERGISMHLNPLDDADNIINEINEALKDSAVTSIGTEAEERRLAAARKHELDMAKVNRSTFTDNTETRNINTNTNGGTVNIIDPNSKSGSGHAPAKRFCTECGKEVSKDGAKFCPFCGAKL